MSSSLPKNWSPAPIGSLRAFEAAGRLLSFTAAAEELGVTQSAVSHAVRDLELRLGATLFMREGRSIALSDAGRRYAPFVREALLTLRAGDAAVADPGGRAGVLTVSVSPSFAAKWLAPRIGDFVERHPDLDLRISATAQHVDFSDPEIDLAIRHGAGEWPGLDTVQLCEECWLPAAAPPIASTCKSAADILKHPLIHHRDANGWTAWFARQEIKPGAAIARGVTVSEMSLAIDAAVAGQGVALVRSALAARDLIAGRLVAVAGPQPPAEIGYWIVRPALRPRRKKVARFTDWLRAEAAADAAALAPLLRGPAHVSRRAHRPMTVR